MSAVGTTIQGEAGAVLTSVVRQAFAEHLQTARILSSAFVAIAVGTVSLSYGIASMGVDTLRQFAVELAEGRRTLPESPESELASELLSA